MSDAATILALIGLAAAAAALASLAALRGWRGWLDLKRLELAQSSPPRRGRGEIAALRDRIRRLEAIAEGRA